jgi:hypothetical protein
MRVARAVEVLPALRPSDRTRRRGESGLILSERRRYVGFRSDPVEPEIISAPNGVATFVTQQIAQEWWPAPPGNGGRATAAYRREPARRRRDLLPPA